MNRISEALISRLDKENMREKIKAFPAHLRQGWEIAKNTQYEIDVHKIRHIVFAGMGGSAIAGDLIRSIHHSDIPVPMLVNRDYEIPNFVNSETLFITSSYSGNTEETLAAIEQAVRRKVSIVCITSGGKLNQIAQQKRIPLFQLIPDYPPRAALGFNLGVLLQIFHRLGIGSISRQTVEQAALGIEEKGRIWSDVDHPENRPLEIAGHLAGHIPLIYASVNRLEFVGYRWKTQLNENSKVHAFVQPFPEMNHNEIVGWEETKNTEKTLSRLVAVVLSDSGDHPRVLKRMEIFKTVMKADKKDVLEIAGKGDTFLERMMDLIHFGDWVSYYLSILNRVNPTEIRKIDLFKKKLIENN